MYFNNTYGNNSSSTIYDALFEPDKCILLSQKSIKYLLEYLLKYLENLDENLYEAIEYK